VKKLNAAICFLVVLLLLSGCSLAKTQPAKPTPKATAQVDQLVPSAEAPVEAKASAVEAPVVQSGTAIKVRPDAQVINKGEKITIEIFIENITGLSAADVQLQFNPTVLQAQDADTAKDGIQVQAGVFLKPDFVPVNIIDNKTGLAQYALVQVAPTKAVDGSGVLASITFEAIADGVSDLAFVKTDLANTGAESISVTPVPGKVTVGNVQPVPATSTPMAGATLTPTLVPIAPTETAVPNQPTATVTPIIVDPSPTTPPVTGPTNTPTPVVILPPTAAPIEPLATPITPMTEAPAGATLGFCYRVQLGDTLFSLGQRFGTTPDDINLANALWPPNHIYANQALYIPQQMGSGPNYYVVQEGDTLAGISEQCHLPLNFMAWVNQLPENTVLPMGHMLKIPIPPFAPPSRPANQYRPNRAYIYPQYPSCPPPPGRCLPLGN